MCVQISAFAGVTKDQGAAGLRPAWAAEMTDELIGTMKRSVIGLVVDVDQGQELTVEFGALTAQVR